MKTMVLLIGNYPPDQQQSMHRFGTMLLQGLTAAGVAAELVRPTPFFGNFRLAGAFVAKWLGYIDKFILFPRQLRKKIAEHPVLVHICDHSNAMYVNYTAGIPTVVTCHDLLAVRGGLGEETDCPASRSGKMLQRWILAGLRRARAVACVSHATLTDAKRLLISEAGGPSLTVATLGLNYPYRKLPLDEAAARLKLSGLDPATPFVLHVGSSLRRKNREGAVRMFARCKDKWNGRIIFVGDPVTVPMRALGQDLGVSDRMIEVRFPDNELLEALYNRATALLYPSRFEGFGWPVAEAQACGCPVICSKIGPLPEVGGEAALLHDVDDEEGFAADILRLTDAAERERWSEKSLRNAARFDPKEMIAQYLEIYRSLTPQL